MKKESTRDHLYLLMSSKHTDQLSMQWAWLVMLLNMQRYATHSWLVCFGVTEEDALRALNTNTLQRYKYCLV